MKQQNKIFFNIAPSVFLLYNTPESHSGFLFVVPNNDNLSKKNAWWKPAVEIFTQVSGWIAGPIILALIVGKALDSYFGTKPWIFLGLTGLAFLISSFGIVRVTSQYMKKIESENKQKEN